MISYRLVYHPKPLGPIISELWALLSLAILVWPWRKSPRSNLTTSEDTQHMISYRLVSNCKPKAFWATPEQSEWFYCMGSPATSPPLCPIWLMVGRCMLPDPTMADWTHPLLWPGDPVPVTQTEATCCWTSWQISLFWAGATCCILIGRPLKGETTLFGWSGLAWVACLLLRSAWLECIGL